MVVCAAGHEIEAVRQQRVRQCLCILHDVFCIGSEFRLRRLAQADGLARDHVHQRPALRAGEDGAVELLANSSSRERIMPPRGPRSVLCVVVVTTSA